MLQYFTGQITIEVQCFTMSLVLLLITVRSVHLYASSGDDSAKYIHGAVL